MQDCFGAWVPPALGRLRKDRLFHSIHLAMEMKLHYICYKRGSTIFDCWAVIVTLESSARKAFLKVPGSPSVGTDAKHNECSRILSFYPVCSFVYC